MNIFHLSDTHGLHDGVEIPLETDIFVFSGDAENFHNPWENFTELESFLAWIGKVNVKHKICISGNHSTWTEKNEKKARLMYQEAGATLLINESVEINGLKFWGSPVTPEFNNWAYMRNRGKLHKLWQTIPAETDVIIAHGPPRGFLDLSENPARELEQCGCSALTKRIFQIRPKAVLFGHIHNFKDCVNQGTRVHNGIIFSNASCVEDGKFNEGLKSKGNIIHVDG